jgi:BTB/POZ domain-containing protein KCTD9
MAVRFSYEVSIARLRAIGLIADDEKIVLPRRLPRHDDAPPLGVTFFKTMLERDVNLSNLTLQRTFIGRSQVEAVFSNTDLQESNLCWNDFHHTDFSGADISHSDIRSSTFTDVRFADANLSASDLRHSRFENCDFSGANLSGAIMARSQEAQISLSQNQRRDIDWRIDAGPEPDGG